MSSVHSRLAFRTLWTPGSGVLDCKARIAVEHPLVAGVRTAQRFGGDDHVAQLVDNGLQDCRQKSFTRPKTLIDGRVGEAELIGDQLQRGAGEAVPNEQRDGRIDEAPACGGGDGRLHGSATHHHSHRPAELSIEAFLPGADDTVAALREA